MSILSRIADTQTNLAGMVTEAAEAAEQLILTRGAAPETDDYFDNTFDAAVHEISGHDYPNETDAMVDADTARTRAAYALGVAVGIRLAGGMR